MALREEREALAVLRQAKISLKTVPLSPRMGQNSLQLRIGRYRGEDPTCHLIRAE